MKRGDVIEAAVPCNMSPDGYHVVRIVFALQYGQVIGGNRSECTAEPMIVSVQSPCMHKLSVAGMVESLHGKSCATVAKHMLDAAALRKDVSEYGYHDEVGHAVLDSAAITAYRGSKRRRELRSRQRFGYNSPTYVNLTRDAHLPNVWWDFNSQRWITADEFGSAQHEPLRGQVPTKLPADASDYDEGQRADALARVSRAAVLSRRLERVIKFAAGGVPVQLRADKVRFHNPTLLIMGDNDVPVPVASFDLVERRWQYDAADVFNKATRSYARNGDGRCPVCDHHYSNLRAHTRTDKHRTAVLHLVHRLVRVWPVRGALGHNVWTRWRAYEQRCRDERRGNR